MNKNLLIALKDLQLSLKPDTKETLYQKIILIRTGLGLNMKNLHNFADIIMDSNIAIINKAPFNTIYGILDKTVGQTPVILINENLKKYNFVLAHEIVHLFVTPSNKNFSCNLDKNFNSNASKYEEWRANEGAAELLMPFSEFIPDYDYLKHKHSEQELHKLLAEKYLVTPQIIKYRIKNLEKEYESFQKGISLDTIDYLI